MLGFCLDDVIMTPVCRPETVVFSPLMLLPVAQVSPYQHGGQTEQAAQELVKDR
jgi:hypothetical protein